MRLEKNARIFTYFKYKHSLLLKLDIYASSSAHAFEHDKSVSMFHIRKAHCYYYCYGCNSPVAVYGGKLSGERKCTNHKSR